MSKTFNELYDSIDTALEISKATLSVVCENAEIDSTSWVLIGVNEQLNKIKDDMKAIDNIFQKRQVEV